MKTFFVILIIVGIVCVALNVEANRTSDSIPIELANHGSLGLSLIGIGLIGVVCAWLLP
jgi:hypothetical protein